VKLKGSAYMYKLCRKLIVKPWPNGFASRHKLKTWVYLWLHLARPCMHSHWIAMTCAHFGQDQICTQVDARFSLFDHPTQVNISWVMSIHCYSNLLAIEIQDMSALKWIFCILRVLARKFSHQTQVSTQVVATCDSIWPRLQIVILKKCWAHKLSVW